MDDIETELRRALSDPRRELPAAADPVTAVHQGMRRRVRRRATVGAGAAALAVVAIVSAAAVYSAGNRDDVVRPVGTVSPSPQPSSPSPSESAVVQTPRVIDVPGVAGFVVHDLSFVSVDKGWALGKATCDGKPCTVVLTTSDGGTTWQRLSAPPGRLTPEGAMCADPCVGKVRFADSKIGYVFAGTQYLTVDGGATWKKTDDAMVFALEPAGGDVIRVVSTTQGCPPGCTFVVQKSTVGSSTWHKLTAPLLSGVGARIVRHGDDVYVFADQHTSGGAGDAHTQIAVSHDRGATWTQRPDPCSPSISNDPAESDAVDAAAGVDGTLVLLCAQRVNAPPTLRLSTDKAVTFGPAIDLPAEVVFDVFSAWRIGVASRNAIVVSGAFGNGMGLLLTTDGGRTFEHVATFERAGEFSDQVLAFTTESVGTWTGPNGNGFWRTTDGGRTWTMRRFSG